MICLSPRLLIATANAFVGVKKNFGQHMEGSLDVALIQHWGFWSHFDVRSERSVWPIGAATTTAELAALGASLGIVRQSPQAGDVFLQCGLKRRGFIRAGVIAYVCGKGQFSLDSPYYDVISIEGDSDRTGELGGGCTVRIARRLSAVSGDLFLRWVELDGFGDGAARTETPSERAAPVST